MSDTDKELWKKRLVFYDELVAKCPAFERKGKTMPYTSANGYMFSLLNKAGELGVRLPKATGEAFIEKHNSGKFTSHGATMRGYVLIPEDLFSKPSLLIELLNEGHKYVMSLPPK